MRARWIGLLGAALGLLALTPATVAAQGEAYEDDAYAFRLPAGNGYELTVGAYPPEGLTGRGVVGISFSRPGAVASYVTRGVVSAKAIRADFGTIGRIELTPRRTGATENVKVKCGNGFEEAFDPGLVEGAISLRGEGGFAAVEARSATLIPSFETYGPCDQGSRSEQFNGPRTPGARLKGVSYVGGLTLSFQVNKNRPRARTWYTASLRERRHGIRISREVKGSAPPGAFTFGPPLRKARLSPPAPFAGTAVARRTQDSVSPIFSGSLTLDFPGRPGFPIAGPGVHVSLLHARFSTGDESRYSLGR